VLALFRNNSPFTVIILLILAILLKVKVLLHPVMPVVYNADFFFVFINHLLNGLFHNNAFAFAACAVLLMFFQAIYLNSICIRRKLFIRSTFFPALAYLLLSSVYGPWNQFNPSLLVNWCLLGAFDVILGFSQSAHPRKHIFNAGFLLGLAALIHFPAILFAFILVISIFMLRPFHLAETVVAVMGFVTPFYFLVSTLYLSDQMPLIWPWLHLIAAKNSFFGMTGFVIWVLIGFALLISCGLYATNLQMPKSSIYNRRNWGVIVISFIITVITAFFSGFTLQSAWLIIIPCAAFIMAMGLSNEKIKGFSNFVFYFALIFILVCQLAIN